MKTYTRPPLLFFTLLPFLFAGALHAQTSVRGQVLNLDNGEAVPYAQVALYPAGEEQATAGGTTDLEGKFSLQAEPGRYRLVVAFIGFDRLEKTSLEVGTKPVELGTMRLQPVARQLEALVVTAEAPPSAVSTDVEGTTVRPDQMLNSVGGSLLDVLRNTPSVTVGQDGSISLRGSGNINILIDGRNSALAADLEQLPADAIESLKIINNPNAKYDAEGAGGVINIKLKRGAVQGTRGKASATVGTRWRTAANLRVNHRAQDWGAYGGYNLRRFPNVGYSTTTRLTFDDQERLEQYRDRTRDDLEHTFNFGGDVRLGQNKLSYEGAVNFEEEADDELTFARVTRLGGDELLLRYVRDNAETENNQTFDNALVWERLYDDERELRATVSHSLRDDVERQRIGIYNGADQPTGETTGEERSINDGDRQTAVAQLDYVQPLWTGKLETGFKSIYRDFDSDFIYERLDPAAPTADAEGWRNLTDVSNRFRYRDQIYAAYVIFGRRLGRFALSGGLRAEQTLVDTRLFQTDVRNQQQYLNFFPSFQGLFHLSRQQELKLTYSRRIDRPNGRRLNPFRDITDSLNVRQGNPNLQPEFIHSLEFGHHGTFGRFDLTSNLFYRHVDGQVDYLVEVIDGISYRRPQNLATSQTAGLELINRTEITDWWSLNGGLSFFYTTVDGTNLDAGFTNDGLAWNARLTTELQLPWDVSFQATGNYTAPEIEAQGRDLARYFLDVSARRSFLDERASVGVTLQDLFDTSNFRSENAGSTFSQTLLYKRETRILLLNFSYSF
ncbi:MAG: TonB-dependent receptor [Catalinimonas sp.]